MVLRVHMVVVAVHQRARPRAGSLLILIRLRAHGPVRVVYQLYLLLGREDLRARSAPRVRRRFMQAAASA